VVSTIITVATMKGGSGKSTVASCLAVHWHLRGRHPTLVDADPQRLRQALVNLLSNALKFTPEGGRVALAAWQDAGGGISFAIRDTGIGMAREKIAAALEPFRQLDGSLARRFEGAGLGLAIAKSLVELHGGTLAIESAVGAGTTVTIALPPVRTHRQASAG